MGENPPEIKEANEKITKKNNPEPIQKNNCHCNIY